MHEWGSLSHVRWECKYNVVIVAKYRKKVLFGGMRKQVGKILRELCRQKGVELLEGNLHSDHIHMCMIVPPKLSIAFATGFLKGKSAVHIHREIFNNRLISGLHFCARGCCVSTVGLDEKVARKYIREQEAIGKQQMELELG